MAKRVAVIGGGIGGLCAAGELARSGVDVTLYEAGSTVGGKAQAFTHRGYTFDTGPTLLTMPETVRAQFQRLGAESLLPRFLRLELQSQYRYPDGRDFSCWEELERAAASAASLHPDDGAGLRAFTQEAAAIYHAAGEPYLEAPYEGLTGFMARVVRQGPAAVLAGLRLSTLDQLARKHFRGEHLRQFVARFATYTGGSPYECSAAFAMIPHLERHFGVSHVEGGMGALVVALEQAVRRAGVRLHLGARAEWERRGSRLLAGPHGDLAEVDAVIVNRDPLEALGRAREPLALSGYVFFVTVARRLALPHHLILFSKDYSREFQQLFAGELPDEPTTYVCHPVATDERMAPPGCSGLYVMVNAPAYVDRARAELLWRTEAVRLRDQALRTLMTQFPELRDAPMEIVGERTPLDLATTGAPGGSIYGFLPHGRFGPFRRPPVRDVTPGVFYAGGGTHPGGGVPLVMLSGHFAARLAGHYLGHASSGVTGAATGEMGGGT
jgi:phytoene desaturase